MPQANRTFRVFVSSTFSDLKAERDALQRYVFPRLRELCMRHGCRFQAIDLRWGVSEEAALDQQTMKVCLQEIRRCQKITPRPNFIVLQGDRYGWQPLPPEIPADEFEQIEKMILDKKEQKLLNKWYLRDKNVIRWNDRPVDAKYLLKPRNGEFEEYKLWEEEVEQPLRSVLRNAINQLSLPVIDRLKYESSATHQEIWYGALDVQDAANHVFGFFRHIDNLSIVEADIQRIGIASEFVDTFVNDEGQRFFDHAAYENLQKLQGHFRSRLPKENIHEYSSKWNDGGVTTDHIGKLTDDFERCLEFLCDNPKPSTCLCEDVWQRLGTVIQDEISQIKEIDSLEQEILAHEKFGEEHARVFIGRAIVLKEIRKHLESDNSYPLIITGEVGSGKSALIARAVEQAKGANNNGFTITRFIGATPASSDCRSLLNNLCSEILQEYRGEKFKPPDEFTDLVKIFHDTLRFATSDKPLVIFLDGLNQLSGIDNPRGLTWLPSELPKNVRFVFSVLETSDCLKVFNHMFPDTEPCKLEPMALREASDLLDAWLANAGRTLGHDQQQEVLSKFAQCRFPLFLKLTFEEAKLWTSNKTDLVLGNSIEESISLLFARFSDEVNHGKIMVSHVFGYLASTRQGLSEDEILEVLSSDDAVIESFLYRSPKSPPVETLPVAVWSRFYFDLKPYISERLTDGNLLLSFSQTSYQIKAGELAFKSKPKKDFHIKLANFFELQPNYWATNNKKSPNKRKAYELAFQQREGGLWDKLEHTLCDFQFMKLKCLSGLLFDIMQDIDQALKLKKLRSLSILHKALSTSLSTVSARPELAVQTICNRLVWGDELTPNLTKAVDYAQTYLNEHYSWISLESPVPETQSQGLFYVQFDIQSSIQSLSAGGNSIAIASIDGHLEIRNLLYGEIIETRRNINSGITALALREDLAVMVYIDRDGFLRSEQGRKFFECRIGETLIGYHSIAGVIAVQKNDSLVAYDPHVNESYVLAQDFPEHLKVLRVTDDGQHILFVAGNKPQIVGVAKWTGNEWETTTQFHTGPPIIDADIDSEGKYVLFATQNRQLQIVAIKTNCSVGQLNYQQGEEGIHGKPIKCVFGKDGSKERVFFATVSGHIASWNWENDQVRRLEDYRQVATDPVFLCMLEVLPLSGNLLVTTQNGAKIISNDGHRSTTNKHNATISGCAIAPSGNVVSISELDQSVRWFSPPGLNQLSAQSFKAPTTVAFIENSSDIIIGTGEGLIWKQPFDSVINPADVFKAFAEPVVSLFVLDSHTVVAASRSGRIIRLHLSSDKVDILWHSTGHQKQHKILHAGKNGICWSVYRDEKSTTNSIVSILHTRDKEEVILKDDALFFDVDVARDGSGLCVASNHVQVLQKTHKGWSAVYQRNTLVSHLSFLGNGEMIAVVLGEDPWLEVWEVSKGLPTIAVIDIPENLSCISVTNNWIAAGFASGNLMSMQFHEKRGKFLKTPRLERRGVFSWFR